MMSLPELIDQPARAYAFVPFTVPMSGLKDAADQGFPSLFTALGKRGIAPIGAPFFNYRRIDMERTLDIEVGIVVASSGENGQDLQFGTLPAGRFVRLEWMGSYDKLETVTAMLIGWARLIGIDFDMQKGPEGDLFACRLEIYETDPMQEPDTSKWVTRLEFKTAS